ncbi:MAG: ComEC/Rec2 family competence protein, partial [Pseudomonadota bacterium]
MNLILISVASGIALVAQLGRYLDLAMASGILLATLLVWWFRDTQAARLAVGFTGGLVIGCAMIAERMSDQITSLQHDRICTSEWQVRSRARTSTYQDRQVLRFPALVMSDCLDGHRTIEVDWLFPSGAVLPEIVPGERWYGLLQLKRIRGRINPGTFDYEGWSISRGFDGRARIRGSPRLISTGDLRGESKRYEIAEWIERWFGDSTVKGLMIALAIGDGTNISLEQWNLLSRTGTVHLVVISGLHLGLVYGLVLV